MNVGIVGHEAAKFTPETEAWARAIIRRLIEPPSTVVVSGHCHLGGIDIWAEQEAYSAERETIVHPPKTLAWPGYKERNLLIARDSDIVHCIVVAAYPEGYKGMRFDYCYHCKTNGHIKSGGCWTAIQAQKLGKRAEWHVVDSPTARPLPEKGP